MSYIKQWQKALNLEIKHLKTFGGTKYTLTNGRLVESADTSIYFFDTVITLKIPAGTSVRIEWGKTSIKGQILSTEGRSVMVALEKSLGDLINDCLLFHDPWELLEQLNQRLDEIKKSKRKRTRVQALMEPSLEVNHPSHKIKTSVHELLLRSTYNPVTFVWGPPGTGKTYTLARVAANHYLKNRKVLILSQSNQAVDVLIGEVARFLKKKDYQTTGKVMRYGSESDELKAQHPELTVSYLLEKQEPRLIDEREQLLKEKLALTKDLGLSFSKRDSKSLLEIEKKLTHFLEKLRSKEHQLVKEASIIGATLAKAATDETLFSQTFDVVIVDEASMVYVPQAAFAASLGKRLIVCGDFKQLPPIAASRDPLVTEWLKEDIFHKAGVVQELQTNRHPHLFLLNQQRRMHPDISAFTNQVIYQTLVTDHPSVHQTRHALAEREPFKGQASILLDAKGMGSYCMKEKNTHSRFNLWQLLLSFQLILESLLNGTKSIGYVTPYRAQAQFMEKLISDIIKEPQNVDLLSATVHRFQGSERECMIFDTVDSFPEERSGYLLTGKESERLINVALTRTQGKFIQVSDTSFFGDKVNPNKLIRQLLTHQENHGQSIGKQQIGSWIKHQHPKLQWLHAKNLTKVMEDLSQAKTSILLSLSDITPSLNDWLPIMREQRALITLISNTPLADIQPANWIEQSLPFNFILIDHKLLWLGLPLSGIRHLQSPYICARLESPQVAEHFIRQLSI
ncbi:AAA domain-containing protein [Pullulanibacillus sp. KACC 23026]|uniref:AAA domain-containing protein n=1 Tax=Pullulanibacillus sp. KACC 23026 TaxID=3028315 RepID=UPI0031B5A5D4